MLKNLTSTAILARPDIQQAVAVRGLNKSARHLILVLAGQPQALVINAPLKKNLLVRITALAVQHQATAEADILP